MTLAYIILLVFIAFGLRIRPLGVDDMFMNSEHCMPIKGICILTVFISHAGGYLYHDGVAGLSALGRFFYFINDNFGQLRVVPFLFLSGYGVAQCLEHKGDAYLSSMPRRRILRTLLRFDFAVACFVVLNLILGISMGGRQIVLSLIGWDSVGNSNWYIFIIVICYAVTWLAALSARRFGLKDGGMCALVWLLLCGVMATLTFFKDSYWYNTMLAFPFGMFYSQHRKGINDFVRGHYWAVLVASLMAVVGIHVLTHFIPLPGGDLWFSAKAIAFSLLLVCLMMRLELRSWSLTWFGRNLFEVYIYQRLPMIALVTLVPAWVSVNHGLFVFVSLAATIAFITGGRFVLGRILGGLK